MSAQFDPTIPTMELLQIGALDPDWPTGQLNAQQFRIIPADSPETALVYKRTENKD